MDRIAQSFKKFDRRGFVPQRYKYLAGADMPLPIGFGQTISQPSTVELMLEWLGAKTGDKVLEIGSGSGWTAALLSNIVGTSGHVFAVELIPDLVEFGQKNCRRAKVSNASFYSAGKVVGLPLCAPFDRILVSASADKLPDELLMQLKNGGKLVIPVLDSIWEITKLANSMELVKHPGFAFVPLL